MPRTRTSRLHLRRQRQVPSNDSDDSDSASSTTNSSSSSSSNTSHNTSVASSINSPPNNRSPSSINLHFSDSDSDNIHNATNNGSISDSDSSTNNPPNNSANLNTSSSSSSSSSSNSSTRSSDADGRAARTRRRPISIFANSDDNSDDGGDGGEAPVLEAISDASTNSSFDIIGDANASAASTGAGSSFGFSPQRSSVGSGGSGEGVSSLWRSNNQDDSDNEAFSELNDEISRRRRDLYRALALRDSDEESEVEVISDRDSPRIVLSPPVAAAVRPPRPFPEGLFSGILSNIRRSLREQQGQDPEEEQEGTEGEAEDVEELDISLEERRELGLVGFFGGSADSLREEMSRVQGGQGQGQGTSSAARASAATPRASSAPVGSGGGGGVGGGPSMISYECSVCLENLDQPASIDLENNGDEGENEVEQMLMLLGGRGGGGGGRGRGRRGRGSLSQRNAVSAPVRRPGGGGCNVNMTDVVATHCGHLYHQVCLEKWFTEQGRRSCPSCRKNVPKSKCIRLYPNIGQDPGGRGGGGGGQHNENAAPPPPAAVAVVVAGGSGSNSSGNPSPGTSSGVSSANEGGQGGAGVRVLPSPMFPTIDVGDGDGGDGGGSGDDDCRRALCQDLKVFHNTLINDFNELQDRYNDLRENDELKEATILSLQDDNERHVNEIERLKRQIQEVAESPGRSAASSSGSAPKRRRR